MQFLAPLNIKLQLVDEIMEKPDAALLAATQLKGMAWYSI